MHSELAYALWSSQVRLKQKGPLKFPKKGSISENQYLDVSNIKNFDDFIEKKQKQYAEVLPDQIEYLAKSYGTEIDKIFSIADNDKTLLEPLNADGENLAQVLFAIRNEMAFTLPDIMLRRTGIALLGYPGKETMRKTAKLAAKELGWNNKEMEIEISKMEEILKIPV